MTANSATVRNAFGAGADAFLQKVLSERLYDPWKPIKYFETFRISLKFPLKLYENFQFWTTLPADLCWSLLQEWLVPGAGNTNKLTAQPQNRFVQGPRYQWISLSSPPPQPIFRQKSGGGYLAPFTFPLGSFGSASPIRKLRGGLLSDIH